MCNEEKERKWELVHPLPSYAPCLHRIRVPGGWVYRNNYSTMVFISDKESERFPTEEQKKMVEDLLCKEISEKKKEKREDWENDFYLSKKVDEYNRLLLDFPLPSSSQLKEFMKEYEEMPLEDLALVIASVLSNDLILHKDSAVRFLYKHLYEKRKMI